MAEIVVLCHIAREELWAGLLPELARDHTVSFVDVPGFGDTPLPPAGATIPAMASDVLTRVPAGAHLIGLSLAGAVALEAAQSGEVAGAIAISPPGYWSTVEAAATLVQIGSMWTSVRFAAPVVELAGRSPVLRTQVWRRLTARPDAVPVAIGDAMVMGLARNMRHLTRDPRVTASFGRHLAGYRAPSVDGPTPVSLLWGDRDTFTSYRRQAARARNALPHARHVTLRGCGHLPLYDDPAEVAAAILEAVATRTT